ncbi:MAG: hypothetical protein Q4C44_04370, partial [bacterium]|nr:hypothetical protein [bacterium]
LIDAKWSEKEDELLAITIDGKESDSFPTGSGYVGTVTCNNATGTTSWNGSKWVFNVTGITKNKTRCNVAFIKSQALKLAILGENNANLGTTITVPGRDVSAYVWDDVETITQNVNYQNYYWTYGTGWQANGVNFALTGTAVTSSVYSTSYETLKGKYTLLFSRTTSRSATATDASDSECINYIIDTTATTITYKELCSNKNQTEAVLASTQDDYGTSYYYRGAITNNYVQYANMCWRIVRITGNDAVKLVLHNYNGLTDSNTTPTSQTPCSAVGDDLSYARFEGDTFISGFNSNSEDNAFVGLKYGTKSASSYAATHANTNASEILQALWKWYDNVLSKQSGFNANNLVDTIVCNDKKVITNTTFNPMGFSLGTSYGYKKNSNYYGAMPRFENNDGSSYGTGPSLVCQNDNNGGKLSKFTYSDTTNGNGALGRKIGILSADEITFAGARYGSNKTPITYLNENNKEGMWTSTPGYVVTYGTAANIMVWGEGHLGATPVIQDFGLRPTISIPSSTQVGGNGTSDDPYIVQ